MKYGNYSRTKRKFNLMKSPITLVVAVIIFAVLVKATWSIHQKVLVSNIKLSQAQTELAKLKARDTDLATQVNYLSSDQGIEAELRTKYRAVKDGESVAVIVDDPNQTASMANASSTAAVGWWASILNWFGL